MLHGLEDSTKVDLEYAVTMKEGMENLNKEQWQKPTKKELNAIEHNEI